MWTSFDEHTAVTFALITSVSIERSFGGKCFIPSAGRLVLFRREELFQACKF